MFVCLSYWTLTLYTFLLWMIKNNHNIAHTFITKTLQKVEHVIIYCFPKISRIVTKFGYRIVGKVTLYAKNNHCIINGFFRGTTKVWVCYDVSFSEKYFAAVPVSDILIRHSGSFYTLNIAVVSFINFYRIISKVWIHSHLLFLENVLKLEQNLDIF